MVLQSLSVPAAITLSAISRIPSIWMLLCFVTLPILDGIVAIMRRMLPKRGIRPLKFQAAMTRLSKLRQNVVFWSYRSDEGV